MEPDTLYYLASAEAKALIAVFFAAHADHRIACHALRDSVGATDILFSRSGNLLALEFKANPPPDKWKPTLKKWRCPPNSYVGPKGWDKSLPPLPSRRKLDFALGIGEIAMRSYERDGRLYASESMYGYEKVGDNYVISMMAFDGKPFGNPPEGCQPLKKSEYYALKGE